MTAYAIAVEGPGLPLRFLVRTADGVNIGVGNAALFSMSMARNALAHWRARPNCSHLTFTVLVAH